MTKIEDRRKLLAEATDTPWESVVPLIDCGEFDGLLPQDEALAVAAVNDYAALLEIARLAQLVDVMSDKRFAEHEELSEALAKWEGQ